LSLCFSEDREAPLFEFILACDASGNPHEVLNRKVDQLNIELAVLFRWNGGFIVSQCARIGANGATIRFPSLDRIFVTIRR